MRPTDGDASVLAGACAANLGMTRMPKAQGTKTKVEELKRAKRDASERLLVHASAWNRPGSSPMWHSFPARVPSSLTSRLSSCPYEKFQRFESLSAAL